tara:strand:- start:1184 stop:2140 length:957 start_codon:yes stop_codon:yes gene_type:complete
MNNLLNNIQGWVHNGSMGNDLMANTDVGVAAGGLGKTIAAAIVQFNKAAVTPATISMAAAVKGSNSVQFPVYSKLGVSDVTNEATGDEDTEVAATSLTTAATTVEILRNHINARVTDLAVHGNADALMINAGQVLGNAVAAEFDANICARFDAFATSKGTDDSLRFIDIMDAVASLETNDAPRPYSAVLHPQQMYGSFGLSNDLAVTQTASSTGAFAHGGAASVGEQFYGAGFVTSIAGINFYTSPQVIDGATGRKKGAIYAKTALGCGYLDFGGGNFIQIATERNELGASTNIVANGYWASDELVDLHGVEIHTEIS